MRRNHRLCNNSIIIININDNSNNNYYYSRPHPYLQARRST